MILGGNAALNRWQRESATRFAEQTVSFSQLFAKGLQRSHPPPPSPEAPTLNCSGKNGLSRASHSGKLIVSEAYSEYAAIATDGALCDSPPTRSLLGGNQIKYHSKLRRRTQLSAFSRVPF